MRYFLDTNVVIALQSAQRQLTRRVSAPCAGFRAERRVVAHALYFGAFRSRQVARNLALIEDLRFEIVAVDKEDVRLAAAIRAELAAAGRPIGSYDLFIAAHAIPRPDPDHARVSEFRRVSDLRWEDRQR